MSLPTSLSKAKASRQLKSLSLDLAQIALDIGGLVEPTPICDGANTLISLGRGDFLGAGLSALGMIPYVGDLAKAGKFPKYLKTVEKAVTLAKESTTAAEILTPVVRRVKQALDLLPDNSGRQLAAIRTKVDEFLRTTRAPRVVATRLPDISRQFVFRKFESGKYVYHEAAGRLGVPTKVKTHRSKSSQSSISRGSGDDAGHLIGNRFGAPGGVENLSPQNWKSNRYGSFKQLEDNWDVLLRQGTGVELKVVDVTLKGESRPFVRKVTWTEISQGGAMTKKEMLFMNPHTARSRNLQDIPATVLEPQFDNVIHVDFGTGQRL